MIATVGALPYPHAFRWRKCFLFPTLQRLLHMMEVICLPFVCQIATHWTGALFFREQMALFKARENLERMYQLFQKKIKEWHTMFPNTESPN